jgi:hypothetical protein
MKSFRGENLSISISIASLINTFVQSTAYWQSFFGKQRNKFDKWLALGKWSVSWFENFVLQSLWKSFHGSEKAVQRTIEVGKEGGKI